MYMIMKYLMEYVVPQLIRLVPNLFVHYEKKWYFTTGLAIQFLNCIKHLQLTVFIGREC